MNGSTAKKRARDLQAITGMPYQAAHRAVMDGTEYEASERSGLTLGDFVTPREKRVWLQINTRDLDCANGRHWMEEEVLGQCVGCGAYIAQDYTSDGDTYEHVVDEDRFFRECIATEMYCNWAPPMSLLGGSTQADYFWSNWRAARAAAEPRPTNGDTADWDLSWAADPEALTSAQLDLLVAVAALQTAERHPSTREAGARMHELMKERGGPYSFHASAPWHGTNPAADQLRAARLIEVHVGMASFRRFDEPAETPQQYWLELTPAGRAALMGTGRNLRL